MSARGPENGKLVANKKTEVGAPGNAGGPKNPYSVVNRA